MPPDPAHNPPQDARLLNYASGIHPPGLPAEAESQACFQAGDALVAYNGATLPARCILCGDAGAGMPVRLGFTWDNSFRVTRIATLQLRQTACVHAFLCPKHRARWTHARRFGGMAIIASVALMLAGMALAVGSESADVPPFTPLALTLVIAGFASTIIALFYFALRSRTLWCTKIQEGYLYLEGASPEFLRHLAAAADKI